MTKITNWVNHDQPRGQSYPKDLKKMGEAVHVAALKYPNTGRLYTSVLIRLGNVGGSFWTLQSFSRLHKISHVLNSMRRITSESEMKS